MANRVAMNNISSREVADMARAIESTFDTQAQIQRHTQISDGAGGWTDTFVDAEMERCFFYGYAGGLAERRQPADRVETVENWTFQFRRQANIKHSDRLKVGDRIFEVGSISGPSTRDIILTVGANEIT